MALFTSNRLLQMDGPQQYTRIGFGQICAGPTQMTPVIARELGAQDKLGGRWELYLRDDSNHAVGLVPQRAARLTQAALKLASDTRRQPAQVEAHDDLLQLYRRHIGLWGPRYLLMRGDAALLGLAVYLHLEDADAKLRPVLSQALSSKSRAFSAALTYVNSSSGPARAKTMFVDAAWILIFETAFGPDIFENVRQDRSFGEEVARLTRFESDIAPSRRAWKLVASALSRPGPQTGASSVMHATRTRLRDAIDSVWDRQLTAERVAMRYARGLSTSDVRRLQDAMPLSQQSMMVLKRIESHIVTHEIRASIRAAGRIFLERERGIADSVARSWDDCFQSSCADAQASARNAPAICAGNSSLKPA